MVFQDGRAFWRDVSPAVPPRQLPTGAEHCPEGQHCPSRGCCSLGGSGRSERRSDAHRDALTGSSSLPAQAELPVAFVSAGQKDLGISSTWLSCIVLAPLFAVMEDLKLKACGGPVGKTREGLHRLLSAVPYGL